MATTSTGITYLSADKIAISLIENPPSRSLTASEKKKIDAYMARPASERASIEQAVLGRTITGGTATPTVATTPPSTIERPFDPRRETVPTTTTPTPTTTTKQYATASNPPPNPVDNWMKIPISLGVYYAGPGAGYPTDDGSIGGAATDGVSPEWAEAFGHYQEFVKANPGLSLPIYKDANDYMLHEAEWLENLPYYQAGYGQDQLDIIDRFDAFASQYGNLNDFQYKDKWDFLANYDQALQQLAAWEQEAGPEAVGFTDALLQKYNDYKQWYYQYGKPGDLMPVDPGDFVTNQDKYLQQLAIWQQQAAEVDQYAVDPAEAARRREEAYREGRYAAEERYREPARLSETWAGWFDQQKQWSGALTEYIEGEYPSLRATWEAGQPRPVGYPTREAARAEAARREKSFEAWLPGQMPGVREEYMAQRPAERGERLWMQQPTMRTVNW